MRLLILGGDGMIGHRLHRHLSERHDCRVTLRGAPGAYAGYPQFGPDRCVFGLDVLDREALAATLRRERPAAVINAVGIVKQRPIAREAVPTVETNALLPHVLARETAAIGARLINFSTDCVFSGNKGAYTETDVPDADDLYGRSKLLGEIATEPHCLTLRTSTVGRELRPHGGLIEWFLAQRGEVRGFRRAIYSGVTTVELARVVERLLVEHPDASGLWHVSGPAIDKCSLLGLVRDAFGRGTRIVPDDGFVCDRSLDSTRFRERFAYNPPDWPTMVAELAADRGPYA